MSSGKVEQNYSKLVQDGLLFNESVIFSESILRKSCKFKSEPYKEGRNRDFNFETIKKIHFILKNNHSLTQKQKFDYCSSQRFFMKLYLKSISERI
ncbi:MAG: hypothetical protein ACFFA7_03510 [Promethearchaeota archaeon]